MAPPQPSFNPKTLWENFHRSYKQVTVGEWDVFMPQQAAPLSIADLKETTHQFQALIADARKQGLKARAIGSSWSLSRAPATSGWTFNTNRLRGRLKVAAADVDASYPGTPDQKAGLYLIQCGNTVADVNKLLENDGQKRALFTSGAANGQTIAGATACGTHGSALDYGALHDHIVAIHLITNANSHFWIERKSRPVMSAAWINQLGATPKRAEDDLFNAVLVSFGSFGVVNAVVLETAPRYLLETRPGTAKLDEALWKVVGALDFTTHPLFKTGGKPYFFQAVINPATDEALIMANYRKNGPASHQPNYDLISDPKSIGPGFDALSAVGMILKSFSGVIPAFSKIAAKLLFDTKPKTGTPGEIYGFKPPLLHVASGSIAVDLKDARKTLEALIQLYKEIGPVPVVLGCRYVKKSPALLAFNKFPMTLAISIDGVDNADSRKYFAAAAARLEALGIDYTQHWGKVNAYTKARVLKAYGGNVAKWLKARKELLPDAKDRAVFDNAYIEERGLAG
jgi:hypothetical protein